MSRLAEVAMDLFVELFGSMLAFVYHCFDRIVIHGYLSSLSRPDQVVYFFRQVVGVPVVSKEVLSRRTADYQSWVEAFASVLHGRGRGTGAPFPAVDQATRTEFELPRSSIRLRTWAAIATSVARASSLWKRNPSPMTASSARTGPRPRPFHCSRCRAARPFALSRRSLGCGSRAG